MCLLEMLKFPGSVLSSASPASCHYELQIQDPKVEHPRFAGSTVEQDHGASVPQCCM